MRGRSIFFGIFLTGCVSHVPVLESNAYTTRRYMGVTYIAERRGVDGVSATRASVLGLWDNPSSMGAGWRSEFRLTFPEGCQIMFLVKTRQQIDVAKDLVKEISGYEEGE